MTIVYRNPPSVKAIARVFKYTDANVDVAVKLGDIPIGSIIVAVRVTTHWTWSAVNAQVISGFSAGGIELTNGTLVNSAGVVHPTLHANNIQPLAANREVWARVANGAANTQGWTVFVVEYLPPS